MQVSDGHILLFRDLDCKEIGDLIEFSLTAFNFHISNPIPYINMYMIGSQALRGADVLTLDFGIHPPQRSGSETRFDFYGRGMSIGLLLVTGNWD